MTTIMFQERFAELVRTGQKRQTIRPPRKRPIAPGDALSLRKWEGSAYRSPQIELTKGTCKAVFPIEITEHSVFVEGDDSANETLQQFALADGFESWGHMRDWFKATHGLPFEGELIQWEPVA